MYVCQNIPVLLYFLKNELIQHQHEIILPFKTPTFSNGISLVDYVEL